MKKKAAKSKRSQGKMSQAWRQAKASLRLFERLEMERPAKAYRDTLEKARTLVRSPFALQSELEMLRLRVERLEALFAAESGIAQDSETIPLQA